MQVAAIRRISGLGIPGRKDEAWKFFPVAKLAAIKIPAIADAEQNFEFTDKLGIEKETEFAALLPIAFGAQTFYKKIVPGAKEQGILKPRDEHSHTVFEIGEGANVSLEILENKLERALSSERIDLIVGENANVELYSAEAPRETPLALRHIAIHQAANSTVRILDLNETRGTGRTSLRASLEGENASFEYRSLTLGEGDASSHSRLLVEHLAPHCKSFQFARNILGGNAYASYDGEVIAGKDCPGTDSSELVNTILLSESAKVSVKPVLKIYHDDVKCTHGNTCGALDPEELFYLQSRGLSADIARKALMRAFAEELLSGHPAGPARDRLTKVLRDTLAADARF